MSLATMETDTGGILANTITNVPGGSQFFKCGIVINRSDLWEEFGISKSVIYKYGPLSMEAVREMATSVRRKFNTSVGVGLAGVVDTDDPSYRLGTIMIGIDDGKQNYTFQRTFPGTRLQIKQRAAIAALFELRKIML